MTELEVRAGEALERKMDRYARVRLDPSPAQAKRARAAVMEAAWRQRLGAPEPASAHAATVSPARRRGLFAGWGPRRLGVSFAAAVLAGLMVGTTAFATSRAGGPLYDVRVALEELTLPADAQARLEAELALAQGRLAEIVEGVARSDPGAVSASVRAYLRSLDDLDDATGGPADRALTAIQDHREILLGVLARAPESAQAGLQNAVARSSMVIARLDAAGTNSAPPADGASGGSGGTGAGGSGSGTGTGNGNGTGNGGGNGAGSGQPEEPGATGGRPEEPGATGGRPDRTPKPARSEAPEEPASEKPAKSATPAPGDGDADEDGNAEGGGKP